MQKPPPHKYYATVFKCRPTKNLPSLSDILDQDLEQKRVEENLGKRNKNLAGRHILFGLGLDLIL